MSQFYLFLFNIFYFILFIFILFYYDVVYVSEVKRELKGQGDNAIGFKVIHDDISSDGGEWRAHRELRSLFIRNTLKIEGRIG